LRRAIARRNGSRLLLAAVSRPRLAAAAGR
jgi:hypothetical protein